jgi:hypothetical protein
MASPAMIWPISSAALGVAGVLQEAAADHHGPR